MLEDSEPSRDTVCPKQGHLPAVEMAVQRPGLWGEAMVAWVSVMTEGCSELFKFWIYF